MQRRGARVTRCTAERQQPTQRTLTAVSSSIFSALSFSTAVSMSSFFALLSCAREAAAARGAGLGSSRRRNESAGSAVSARLQSLHSFALGLHRGLQLGCAWREATRERGTRQLRAQARHVATRWRSTGDGCSATARTRKPRSGKLSAHERLSRRAKADGGPTQRPSTLVGQAAALRAAHRGPAWCHTHRVTRLGKARATGRLRQSGPWAAQGRTRKLGAPP